MGAKEPEYDSGTRCEKNWAGTHLILGPLDSHYYWHCLVRSAFAMVTNGSAKARPTEAYFFALPEASLSGPSIIPFPAYTARSSPSPATHALRVSMSGDIDRGDLPDELKAKFEIGVLPSGSIDEWVDGLVFGSYDLWWLCPLTWQAKTWGKCGMHINPNTEMQRQLHTHREGGFRQLRNVKKVLAAC